MILGILTDYVVSSLIDKHKDKLPGRVVKLITTDTSFQSLVAQEILPKSLASFAKANPTLANDENLFEQVIAPALATLIYNSVYSGKLESTATLQANLDELAAHALNHAEKNQLRNLVSDYSEHYRAALAEHQDAGTALIMQTLSQLRKEVLASFATQQTNNEEVPKGLLARSTSVMFISYSRANTDFAADLETKLKSLGFNVKRDRSDLRGGQDWWQQLKEMIDQAQYMILCMSPEAIASENVADEWHYARGNGTEVIPIIAGDVDFDDAPRWMKRKHWIDFRDNAPEQAVQWRSFINQLNTIPMPRKVAFMVDDLPDDYVKREEELEAFVASLIDESKNPVAITAAIRGAGGYGKSTLARAICHDNRVRAAFDDGIFWVQLKQNLSDQDVINLALDLVYKINGKRPDVTNLEMVKDEIRHTLSERYILLVIDDVWHKKHLMPFLQGGKNCGRLITTRMDDSLPQNALSREVDAMTVEESKQLILHGLDALKDSEVHDEAIIDLIERLGRWALLLKIANGMLHKRNVAQKPAKALQWIHQALNKYGFQKLMNSQSETERNRAASASILASLNLLDEEKQAFFHQLAIFPEDLNIPLSALEKLWQLDDWDSDEFCQTLKAQSLVINYIQEQSIRLHDVVRQVLIDENEASLVDWQRRYLERYAVQAWHQLPEDEDYLWRNLAYHLIEADKRADLNQLLCASDKWMKAKFIATEGNSAYVADIELALQQYADPLSRDDLLTVIDLWTARQVVNAQVNIYTDEMLGTMVLLGKTTEARSHARLRTSNIDRFNGLLQIYYWQLATEESEKATVLPELIEVAQVIEDASWKAIALRDIAVALASVDVELALGIAQIIESTFRKAEALRDIAVTLASMDVERALDIWDEALSVARIIEDDYWRANALSTIAGALASVDVEYALDIANNIEHADSNSKADALSTIAGALASVDVERAMGIANSIEDTRKARTLEVIAIKLVSVDVEYALNIWDEVLSISQGYYSPAHELASVGLAAELASVDVERALGFARDIKFRITSSEALSAIAEKVTSVDVKLALDIWDEALLVAQGIENTDSNSKADALSAIAIALASVDVERAFGIWNEAISAAQGIESPFDKINILINLVAKLASLDVERALGIWNEILSVARNIENADREADALSAIAIALASVDVERGLSIANNINDAWEDGLGSIMIELASVDMERALDIAISIEGAAWEYEAWRDILSILALENLEGALDIANSTEDDYWKAQTLEAIAIKLVSVDVERALNIAHDIEDTWTAEALSAIAVALVSVDVERALNIANSIENAFVYDYTLENIVEKLSTIDVERALGIKQGINNIQSTDALKAILVALASVDVERAMDIANSIEDTRKAEALSAIAVALTPMDVEYAFDIWDEAVAQGISEDPGSTSKILKDIAEALVSVDVERTLDIASNIEDYYWKAEALSAIAEALTPMDVERALDITNSIVHSFDTSNTKTKALRTIAQEVQKNGHHYRAFTILDVRSIEDYLQYLAGSQASLLEQFSDDTHIWHRVMLQALQIICWVRPSWQAVRDSFQEMIDTADSES